MTDNNSTRLFPHNLLTALNDEKTLYFQNKIISHDKLLNAHQAVLSATSPLSGAEIVSIVGPTGVGKTTLLQRMIKDLSSPPNTSASVGSVAVAGVEASALDSAFDWKDFFNSGLKALQEPSLSKKTSYQVVSINDVSTGRYSRADLRNVFQDALIHRQTRVFYIDEAQHLTKVAGGRRLLDQIDTVKSLASLSNTVFVLIGTYDLLNLTSLNAQLDRRTAIIHLERYFADRQNDMDSFEEVLATFQKHLPLRDEPDLLSETKFFYEGSLGCIGMLKTWLVQALISCLDEREQHSYITYCRKCKVSSRRLLNRISEIREGEKRLNDDATEEDNQARLQAMLGLTQTNISNEARDGNKPSIKKASPGIRNPHRDPVGNPYTETQASEI